MKGLIHVYHGMGKGKTTAAVGLSIRGCGNGLKVSFAQFLKSSESCEINILKSLDSVKVFRSNKVFGFYETLSEDEKIEIKKIHEEILLKAFENVKDGGLLVLDEILDALNCNVIDENNLKNLIENRNEKIVIVMTGRNPKDWILEKADYVTEMKKIKHPYDVGVMARKGIEY